jgi:hypothetical protein
MSKIEVELAEILAAVRFEKETAKQTLYLDMWKGANLVYSLVSYLRSSDYTISVVPYLLLRASRFKLPQD